MSEIVRFVTATVPLLTFSGLAALALALLLRRQQREERAAHAFFERTACRYAETVRGNTIELLLAGRVDPEHLERFEAPVTVAFRPLRLQFEPADGPTRLHRVHISPAAPEGTTQLFGALEADAEPVAVRPGHTVAVWIWNAGDAPAAFVVRIRGERVR